MLQTARVATPDRRHACLLLLSSDGDLCAGEFLSHCRRPASVVASLNREHSEVRRFSNSTYGGTLYLFFNVLPNVCAGATGTMATRTWIARIGVKHRLIWM